MLLRTPLGWAAGALTISCFCLTGSLWSANCPDPRFAVNDGHYAFSYGSSVSADARNDVIRVEYCLETSDKHALAFNWVGPRFSGFAFPGSPASLQIPTLSPDTSTIDSLLYYGAAQKSMPAPYIPVQSKQKPTGQLKRASDPLINRIKMALGSETEKESNFIVIDAELASYTFPLASGDNLFIYQWRNVGPIVRHQTIGPKEMPENDIKEVSFRWNSDAVLSAQEATIHAKTYGLSLRSVPQAFFLQSKYHARRDIVPISFLGNDSQTVGSASVAIYVPDNQ